MEGPEVSNRFHKVSEVAQSSKSLPLQARGKNVTDQLPGHLRAVNGLDSASCLAQVDRLVNSPQLHDSEGLSKLLRYLAEHTLSSPEGHLKEYQIATEVLGRPTGFDPQSDAGVRVQVARLRNKLRKYYLTAGATDPLLVTIPKGGYALNFEKNELSPAEPEGSRTELHGSQTELHIVAPPAPPRRHLLWILCVTTALLTSLVTAGCMFYFLHVKPLQTSATQSANQALPALQTFWRPFLYDQGEPFAVFSNARFVGDPFSGMYYYNPSRDSLSEVSEYYTGVGEVMGTVRLQRLFQKFGREFRLKRSGLFSLDDAHNNDLIFLGSPTEDTALDLIPNTREFAIRRLPGDRTRWSDVVVLHPRTGEPSVYHSTLRPTSTVNEDYAIIAFVHGLDPGRHTLILEGISTLGTQAAVDYMCDESSVAAILHQLNVQPGKPVPFFEALVKIKVANDVPLETQLISVRPLAD